MDFLKETEHVAGKMGFSRNIMLMKMWSRREGWPVIPWRVREPSGTRDMKFLQSSQSLSVCAHEEVGRSGGDQVGEWVLKPLPIRRGPVGRGSERR